MKEKSEFNIDYLKLCYRQPEGLFQEIASTDGNLVYRFNYDLLIIERNEQRILAKVLIPAMGESWALGTLTLNHGGAFGDRAFFEFHNRSLYEVLSWQPGQRPFSLMARIIEPPTSTQCLVIFTKIVASYRAKQKRTLPFFRESPLW